jgi:hypothetical protein
MMMMAQQALVVIAFLLSSTVSQPQQQQHLLRGQQTKIKGVRGVVHILPRGDGSRHGKMGQRSIPIAHLDLFTIPATSSNSASKGSKRGKSKGTTTGTMGPKSISIGNLDLFSTSTTTTTIATSSGVMSSGNMGKKKGMGMSMKDSNGNSITSNKGIIITNGGTISTNVGAM